MATTETYPIGDLRAALERTATDPSIDAEAKMRELGAVREQINHLLGHADTLIGQQRLAVEAAALQDADRHDRAVSDSALREELIRRGMATPEQCDLMGLFSDDEVEARDAEGSLAEALSNLTLAPDFEVHPTVTTSTASGGLTYVTNGAAEVAPPPPEAEPQPPEPAEPEPEPASTLTEQALLEAYTEADGDATEIVVSPDLELVAKRIVAAPMDPDAEIGPLVGLLECRTDDSLPRGSWRLGGDASTG